MCRARAGHAKALSVPPLGQVYWRAGGLKITLGDQKSILERLVTHFELLATLFFVNMCSTCDLERSKSDFQRFLSDLGETLVVFSPILLGIFASCPIHTCTRACGEKHEKKAFFAPAAFIDIHLMMSRSGDTCKMIPGLS